MSSAKYERWTLASKRLIERSRAASTKSLIGKSLQKVSDRVECNLRAMIDLLVLYFIDETIV